MQVKGWMKVLKLVMELEFELAQDKEWMKALKLVME